MVGVVAVVVGLTVVAVATVASLRGVEPFPTWYYIFAWYGTLLAGGGAWVLLGGRSRKRQPGDPTHAPRPGARRWAAFLLTLFAWSAIAWLFFELINFRLRNWYYIFLTNWLAARWIGTLVAFATVFPALFLAEALLHRLGVARDAHSKPLLVSDALLARCQIAGAVMLGLALVWPRVLFPLVWGAVTLLADPAVYRRARERSLLGDLAQGRPGRILRLLLGGLTVGALWELFNIAARAKWIYTVPGLEALKLFEMPVLGFLGFPPFALECFALWQLLVVTGLAVPRTGTPYRAPARRRIAAAIVAPVFAVLVLRGIDAFTVSSLAPRLDDMPGVPAARLSRAGLDPFRLAAAEPAALAAETGATAEEARAWVEAARLATLRGIGTRHATQLHGVAIHNLEQLARADADDLAARLERHTGQDVVEARVRVWVRGANATMNAK